jgi:hypothetical protein
MARKKDLPSVVVEFFEAAPIDTAVTVLAICKGIVARRQPAKPRAKTGVTRRPVAAPDEQAGRVA